MSAEPRRLWKARRCDGGVLPPRVGYAKITELVRCWELLVKRITALSSAAMCEDVEQMVARGERIVALRVFQLQLLGDALTGLYSVLREQPPDFIGPVLCGGEAAPLFGVETRHSHVETIELVVDALLRERAAYEEVRTARTNDVRTKLLHAHTMRQALLVDALRAQMVAALAEGTPDRRAVVAVTARA